MLGYSIYDTIIIFDRIRENTPTVGYNRRRFDEMINRSIRQVVRRSIYTSIFTLIPITALLIFGESTLSDFAFALLVGIVAGTYSSIFIASPVLSLYKAWRAGQAPARHAPRSGVTRTSTLSLRPPALARLRYHVGSRLTHREVVMRGTVGETLERLILLQIGAAAATRDKVQEIVDSLIEQGRIEREEGRTVVDDVMNRARERSTGARSLVDASVQQGLRRGGLPTREDYEDLVFRIEQLEHRVRMLEDRPARHRPPPRRANRRFRPSPADDPRDAAGALADP